MFPFSIDNVDFHTNNVYCMYLKKFFSIIFTSSLDEVMDNSDRFPAS